MITVAALIEKFKYALENDWGYIWGKAGDIWTAAEQSKATREQTIEYGRQWIGHYVADCSGLFSWAFKKLGGYMYHGSNTMYKSYCTAKGTFKNGKRTDGKALRPGTALFTGNDNDHGHVGLYIGDGWVIEAASTKDGVIKSKASKSKWTYWGELKGVTYTEEKKEETSGKTDALPTLRRGDKGEYVTLAQTALKQRGYNLGSYGIDGDFGRATEAAVKQFQRDWGLKEDGVIGAKTWAVITSAPVNGVTYSVTITGLDLTQAKALVTNYPGSKMEEVRG